jgi:hypothetical protein
MTNFTGMTRTTCAAACNVDGCVVAAGKPLCMHPCMSGVPHKFKADPEIQTIYAEACVVLGVPNAIEAAA